jgi:iron complex outermembrane receptor protein
MQTIAVTLLLAITPAPAAIAATPDPSTNPSAVAGRVLDSTGAAISDTPVTVRDLRTGEERVVRSGADGRFEIVLAAGGRYRVRAEAPGFTAAAREVTAGTVDALELTLSPASLSEEVTVTSDAGVGSRHGSTATKTDTPLIETPQSVSVVTRERLDAQAVQHVQEALRYTAGVRAETYGYDNRGDWAIVRGASFGQYVDGLQMLFGSYNNTRPDPFTLERVDVLRGPSSVLYGQGTIGGVVNLTTKRPLAAGRRHVALQTGNHGRRQLALDVTGPLRHGTLLYRLVAVGRDSGTQVDHVSDDRLLVSPSVTWRPGTNTSLTLLANIQKDDSGSSVGFFPWEGTLLPAENGPIPTHTFISEPGFDEYVARQRAAGWAFEHRFGPGLVVRQNFRYSASETSYQSIYSRFNPRPTLNADKRTIDRTLYVNKPEARSVLPDTHVQATFATGAVHHRVLAGFDYQHATITARTASGIAPAIDVYAPLYGNFTEPVLTDSPKSTQSQRGIYAQDQIKVGGRWTALVGLRRDQAEGETAGNAQSRRDDAAATGRVGLVYLSPSGVAPYVSYAESFQPLGGFDIYNVPFKPRRGAQWEAGVKLQPARSGAFVTAALFDLRDTNRKTPDPANPANSIQVGEARVRGAELEAAARLASGWDVLGSYSYTDSEITESHSADLGKRLASTPEHLASLWTTYRLAIGGRTNLRAGGGVRYVGTSYDGMDAHPVPAVTLVDATAAYETGAWRLSFNAANLADKTYVSTCLARGDCFYGSRRTITATLECRF